VPAGLVRTAVSLTKSVKKGTNQANGPQQKSFIEKGLPPYWVVGYIDGTEKYYHNTLTNETSWDFPGSLGEDELAGITADAWGSGSSTENGVKYNIIVTPDDDNSFEIEGGECQFGGSIPDGGLICELFHSYNNPGGSFPFSPDDVPRRELRFLVKRGDEAIATKARNCQDAGAAVVFLINDSPDESILRISRPADGSDAGVAVSVTSIALMDGFDLLATLQEGIRISVEIVPTNAEPTESADPDPPQETVKVYKGGWAVGVKLQNIDGIFLVAGVVDGSPAAETTTTTMCSRGISCGGGYRRSKTVSKSVLGGSLGRGVGWGHSKGGNNCWK